MSVNPKLTLPQLRRRWAHNHGLDRTEALSVAEISRQFGWPRTLGGVDVYVAFAARNPHFDAAELDAAVARVGGLRVIPAARSCIYVVPSADVDWAIRYNLAAWQRRSLADCARAGVQEAELLQVVATTAAALGDAPKTTDQLRNALPTGAVRRLGDLGKKYGMSTCFPLALRWLESQGRAQRTPADGHLRNERYVWQKPQQPPTELSESNEELHKYIAAHFFSVSAPARLKDLADWAGLSQRDAKAAMQQLDLQAVEVEGQKDLYYVPSSQRERLNDDLPVAPPRLLSLVDPLTDYRSALKQLVDERHHDVELTSANTKPMKIRDLQALWLRCVLDDGELVGVWEFDPERKCIDFATFRPLQPDRLKLLQLEVERLTELLRDRLQDARAFSLDTDASLKQRSTFVRGMRG